MDLNKVFILGRLTADPRLRTTSGGQQVASFGVATNRVWKDKTGNKQQDVQYHNIVVWGRQAEVASQFLSKGSAVLVEGRLQTRSWQNQQGQNQRTTEIIGERIQLGPKPFGQGQGPAKSFGDLEPAAKDKDIDISPANELPQIDINEEDIKAEDLPF